MAKIAIISSEEKSNWISCQSIDKNLLQAYLHAFPKNSIKIFNYHVFMRQDQIDNVANEIIAYKPDYLVHINHRPHIDRLLYAIEDQINNIMYIKRPQLYFHIYGDFTLYLPQWINLSPLLKKYRVLFLCASDKQLSLLKKLIDRPDSYVKKCPFPVDNFFSYKPSIRKTARKKLGLKKKQFAFVYAGRMSFQKNVLSLLKNFSFFLKQTQFDAKLYLAGKFDDIGQPFLNSHLAENEFFYHYNELLKSLPKEHQKQIVFLGYLSRKDLRDIYNACDYYVSLSVYNDEDYGMAPAEALICGLPCILTDWGGFSSFSRMIKGNNPGCQLVPVTINSNKVHY
ncbi:MAG: glycosyltransferase family 4 protein, partial [Halobacteriovoraceae bacterium]|nr:glycosyltransferase family 4 protein [Halobacteriovoraceae bacterium]